MAIISNALKNKNSVSFPSLLAYYYSCSYRMKKPAKPGILPKKKFSLRNHGALETKVF